MLSPLAISDAENVNYNCKYLRTNGHYFQVMERAKVSESLDELRARTCAQYSKHNGFQNATMLSKKRKHNSIS